MEAKKLEECCVALEEVVVDGKSVEDLSPEYRTPERIVAGLSTPTSSSWAQCVFRQCDYRRT